MDDQHGPGTCAKTEELSSQVGAGSKQSALLLVYAQRGAAKKCAARLLLASVECVGRARLQSSHMATTVRAPEKARQRRAREEVVCWRRRPNPRMTTFKCLLRQGPSQGSRWHMNRPASESRAHRRIGVGAAQGGRRERPSRAEGVRARGERVRACVRARARRAVHGTQAARLRACVSVGERKSI